MKSFISWRRVSTSIQGMSGLGLEAQQDIINYFAKQEGEVVADYCEVYTGTSLDGCIELHKAIKHCKEIGATLIIAKSDRFRNVMEALSIYKEMNGNIMFCDLPNTDKFTLTLFFAMAEREALLISIRTQAALDAKRKRGEEMGGTQKLWDKNSNRSESEKEEYRSECTRYAASVSSENRLLKAKSNQNNKAFWFFMKDYIKIHGEPIPRTTYWKDCAEELNKRGMTTASGKPFTNGNACSMYTTVRNIFKTS